MGRILGIDHGDARIGIAMSDETEFLASPLATVQNRKAAIDEIVSMVVEHKVEMIVVGLPRNMNGTYGPATEKVRTFVEKLSKKTAVPIVEWDERLSTVSAHSDLRAAGLDSRKHKAVIDKIAARIILQNYLDAKQG